MNDPKKNDYDIWEIEHFLTEHGYEIEERRKEENITITKWSKDGIAVEVKA